MLSLQLSRAPNRGGRREVGMSFVHIQLTHLGEDADQSDGRERTTSDGPSLALLT